MYWRENNQITHRDQGKLKAASDSGDKDKQVFPYWIIILIVIIALIAGGIIVFDFLKKKGKK